jgi:hypothetical protein
MEASMSYSPSTHVKEGNLLLGAVVMVVGSLLLFWLPGVGSFIAGVVGGKIAGNVRNALIAAALPALILFVGALILSALTGPIGFAIAFFAGVAGLIVALVHGIGLLLGAFIGGLL